MRWICSVCENMYINTCSIRKGHFTCDAVAVNSKQSSVLNDLNYTVVDVIYHSVYILHLLSISVSSNTSNIHVYTLSVLNCLSSYYTGVNLHTYLSMYCMCLCISLYGELLSAESLLVNYVDLCVS